MEETEKKYEVKEMKIEKKSAVLIITAGIIATIILASIASAAVPELKLPYSGGESWIITEAYDDITHQGKDLYALDFTLSGCDAWDKPILAVADGTVIDISTGHVNGELKSYGNKVVIKHADGYTTLYGHLNQVLVEIGQKVVQGTKIGTAGNTGYTIGSKCKDHPGTHLHFRMLDADSNAYKPEPMSGYTGFTTDQIPLSDNYGVRITVLSVACKGQSCLTTTVTQGDELTFVYTVNNQNTDNITNFRLGAQIRIGDPQGDWKDDPANDVVIDKIGPGETKEYSRKFIIPASVTPGFYDIRGVILYDDTGDWITSKESYDVFVLQSQGLHARYYNEPIYRNDINAIAKPDVERIDSNVDFAWNSNPGKLPPGILNDGWWSADWAGYIYADKDGIYNFNLNSDDGSWLFIDGIKVIDNGGDHAPRWVSGQITLTKGYHSIWVKYFESLGGEANLNLYWMPPEAKGYVAVPTDKLFVVNPKKTQPKLQLSKKVAKNMPPGNAMTYTLYYTNYGGKTSSAVLEDTISLLEVDFISASDGGTYDPGTGKITWTIDSIGAFPLGIGSRTITVRIKEDVASGFLIKNTATIAYGSDSSTATAHTIVTKSDLPPDVGVGPIAGNTGGTTSVFWKGPITFSYYSACAAGVVITIHYSDESYLVETMTKSSDNFWTYTVPGFEPHHGKADVTYTIAGCDGTKTLPFSIYIDPAGFIYDIATGKRISNATVWLQQPDNQGNWHNVETGQTPAIMQPDINPLITNQDGQYQWDVLTGTYRIHVEAPGYYPEDSIAVNIPPPVTDLNVGLTHLPDDISPITNINTTGIQGNNNWYASDVEVNLTATDNEGGSGVKTTEYTFDNIAWNTYTVPFNVTSEGTTMVYYRSIDYADNSETVKTQTISIDKIKPNINISGVTNNSYYNSNVTVYVNSTDANLYNQSITLNGYPYINGTNITEEGSYALVASAADLAGNSASETLNFVIDRTPPEASISFNVTTKSITVYNNETGSEASYIILPTKKNKDNKKDHDKDSEAGWNLRQYALQDKANNSLILILKHKSEGKEAKAEIVSIQYNNGIVITVENNNIEAEYSVDKNNSVKELEQKTKTQKYSEIEAKYSLKKNQTEIKVKTKDQKEEKEIRPGLVILEILTDKGSLRYNY